MKIRSRRVALALAIAGSAMAISPFVAVAGAQEEPTSAVIGTFDVQSNANGVGAWFGNPGRAPDPVATGLIPDAFAQLAAGPAGQAQSTIFWPGPLAGNAGSLANVIGTPLPPEVVANANDPVKAYAAGSGEGQRQEQTLGPMYAMVDGGESLARTTLSDFGTPGVVTAARVVTSARNILKDGVVTSVAQTLIQDLEIAGVLKIANMTTLAEGKTDGSTATLNQQTILSGVTIQGQGITIDDKGMHAGGNTSDSPTTPLAEGVNQVITNMGMTAYVTQPMTQETEAGAGTVRSGSLIVDWKLGDGGDYFTLAIGGSWVMMRATPGSDAGFGGADLGGDLDSFGGGATGSIDNFGGATGNLVAGGYTAPSLTPTGGSNTGGGVTGLPFSLTAAESPSDRVPWGWMLIGILGALMFASGLHTLRTNALEAALLSSACPLDH